MNIIIDNKPKGWQKGLKKLPPSCKDNHKINKRELGTVPHHKINDQLGN